MNKLCYVIEEMQSGCERRLLTTNIIAMGQSAFVIHNNIHRFQTISFSGLLLSVQYM